MIVHRLNIQIQNHPNTKNIVIAGLFSLRSQQSPGSIPEK
jgi:hypothetical protein